MATDLIITYKLGTISAFVTVQNLFPKLMISRFYMIHIFCQQKQPRLKNYYDSYVRAYVTTIVFTLRKFALGIVISLVHFIKSWNKLRYKNNTGSIRSIARFVYKSNGGGGGGGGGGGFFPASRC